jgi:hypothetical protein
MSDSVNQGRTSRRRLVIGGLGLFAAFFFVVGGSFGYCEVVPSYEVCRDIPTCTAMRVEYVDGGSGPAWHCRSRWAR